MKRSNVACIRSPGWLNRAAAAAVGAGLAVGLAVRADAPAEDRTAPDPASALERLQRDYLALARVASTTAAELARLKEHLRLAEAARATAERDRERLSADLARAHEELRRMADTAAAAQRDLGAALDEKIQLQDEMAAQTRNLRDLQRRYERLEKQSGEAETLRATLEELRRERDRWMRERADLERRLARAEGGRATADPRRPPAVLPPEAVAAERAENARLRRAIKEDREAFAAERTLLESQLTEVLESLERERHAHLQERARLQRSVEILRARSEIRPAAAPIPPPSPTPESAPAEPAELHRLRNDLEAAIRQRETLEGEISKLTDHAVALERKIAELEDRAARAAEADAWARTAGEAQRDLARARERMAALEALISELRASAARPIPN